MQRHGNREAPITDAQFDHVTKQLRDGFRPLWHASPACNDAPTGCGFDDTSCSACNNLQLRCMDARHLVRTELSRVCELLRSESGISDYCAMMFNWHWAQEETWAKQERERAEARQRAEVAWVPDTECPGSWCGTGGEYCDACWSKWQML